MKRIYKKGLKIKYKNELYQIIIRDDNKKGFLKIASSHSNEVSYTMPTAQEFLHLNSVINKSSISF